MADFQQYVKEMKAERGFRVEPIYECCLLAEEVGELISAVSSFRLQNRNM